MDWFLWAVIGAAVVVGGLALVGVGALMARSQIERNAVARFADGKRAARAAVEELIEEGKLGGR